VTGDSGAEAPLQGLVVLDFSRVLSGPYCGRALADLGADVIKIEPPRGDLSRFFWPRRGSLSMYFAQQNAGKRNISLDLNRPEAQELLRRLATRADIVLENFRPGVMARWGLDYERLSTDNPRLVYGSITGYGQDGPWASRRAFAVVIHAEMGMTARELAIRPGKLGNMAFSHADVYAGLHALSGILAALFLRERTGRGQHVDVAMGQALLSVNEHVHAELAGHLPPAPSPATGSPVVEVGDGRLVTISGNPCEKGTFELNCDAMDRPDLADDPRFVDEPTRRRHHDELQDIVRQWAATVPDVHEIERRVAAAGLAMGVVRTVAEVGASEWAAARGAITEIDDWVGGTVQIPQASWRFSDATAAVQGGAAWRGQHNRDVFGSLLGLGDDELDRLEADGVLSARPPRTT
jgi:crotonobetainyl-CoA:carnitine CoA-transferase CaiB-like acyl-CoA transferase